MTTTTTPAFTAYADSQQLYTINYPLENVPEFDGEPSPEVVIEQTYTYFLQLHVLSPQSYISQFNLDSLNIHQ